jgi:acetyl-CoA carboxylase carboxyltransferase component
MSWEKEVQELETRRDFAAEMGGKEGVARQRRRGKLTVRERIDALSDPGSFREFMGLTGKGTYEDNELSNFNRVVWSRGLPKLMAARWF